MEVGFFFNFLFLVICSICVDPLTTPHRCKDLIKRDPLTTEATGGSSYLKFSFKVVVVVVVVVDPQVESNRAIIHSAASLGIQVLPPSTDMVATLVLNPSASTTHRVLYLATGPCSVPCGW